MFGTQLDAFSDEELIELLRADERQRRTLEGRQAEVVEVLDRRKAFRRDGHSTVHGLVRTITRRPTRESKDLLRTGRLLREFPTIAAVFDAGELGVAQVHVLAKAYAHERVGDQFEAAAEVLVDAAMNLKYSDFEYVVDGWINAADMDGANRDAEQSHDNRDAYLHLSKDGFRFTAQGCASVGAALKEILGRFVDAEWDRDWQWTKHQYGEGATPAHMPRTDRQRRADAWVAVCNAAVSTPAGAQAPEPVANVIVDQLTLCKILALFFGVEIDPDAAAEAESLVPITDRRCHTTSGVPVAPVEVLAAILSGYLRRVVLDSKSVVIDLGRKQRLFAGDVRFAAHFGRSRCYWPGCEVPAARCQTDHLTEWQHNGRTCPDDGAPSCPHHNLFKTNHHYTVTRDNHGHLRTYRPDGTEVA